MDCDEVRVGMLNRLHFEMIKLYNGDARRIQHFCKVHSYAKLIAEMENVDKDTLFIIETAAFTHDIGIHLCEENMEIAMANFRKRRTCTCTKAA